MRIIAASDLDDLTVQARSNQRLRKNLNLHTGDAALCQRLFNAIEPDSYIPPHRHLDRDKDETFYLVRGKLGVLTFSTDGTVTATALLEAGGKTIAVDIPHGVYHTAVSLAAGTIFFEAKGGPYLPLAADEIAPWAPVDGPAALTYHAGLKALFRLP